MPSRSHPGMAIRLAFSLRPPSLVCLKRL